MYICFQSKWTIHGHLKSRKIQKHPTLLIVTIHILLNSFLSWQRLISENSNIGNLLCDPFMGSGTTLVEAIVNDRRTYGTDISPVAGPDHKG